MVFICGICDYQKKSLLQLVLLIHHQFAYE